MSAWLDEVPLLGRTGMVEAMAAAGLPACLVQAVRVGHVQSMRALRGA